MDVSSDEVLGNVLKLCEDLQAKYGASLNIIDVDQELLKSLVNTTCQAFAALGQQQKSKVEPQVECQEEDEDAGSQRSLQNAMQILYYLEQACCASRIASRLIGAGLHADEDATKVSMDELVAGLAPFCKMDMDQDINKFQQLLLFLLNMLQHRGYKRYGSDCYEQLFTPEGYNTHAWTLACTIKDFVYAATRKETNFDQWLNLTQNKGNAQSAVEYLVACKDVQFPVLVKQRSIFAFRNGLYDARSDRFYQYADGGIPNEFVASKHFDLIFEDGDSPTGDWMDIPTPNLQSILDFQGYAPEVARWMYIMIGRLMYELNDLDRWQVIPYLKGQASSGKSTILLRVCRNLYDKADVGVLSNNIEKKFGIGAFADKYIFVAPEIKSDLQMEQAEFQSIVSGEDMSICIKYQTAHTSEWKVPGIMAGNEVPAWVDNSGSITRRIVLFDFPNKVDNADMDLGKRLEAEMARLIKKCNKGYQWAVQNFAKDSIWKHLPAYFHSTRDELSETTNVLEHFLKSNALKFGSDAYMPWNDFLSLFQVHTRTHNFKWTQNFTKDFYAAAFLRYSLRKTAKESRLYRGSAHTRVWLEGADVADGFEDQ